MNWGKGISLVIVFFIIMTIGFVIVAMRQNIDLVAENYYEQDLVYEQKIQKHAHTQASGNAPVLNLQDACLNVQFPKKAEGKALLFRPSDKNIDVLKSFVTNDTGLWVFCPENFPKGMWKISFEWQCGNEPCYLEQEFYRP